MVFTVIIPSTTIRVQVCERQSPQAATRSRFFNGNDGGRNNVAGVGLQWLVAAPPPPLEVLTPCGVFLHALLTAIVQKLLLPLCLHCTDGSSSLTRG
jgi:hypothetical protein